MMYPGHDVLQFCMVVTSCDSLGLESTRLALAAWWITTAIRELAACDPVLRTPGEARQEKHNVSSSPRPSYSSAGWTVDPRCPRIHSDRSCIRPTPPLGSRVLCCSCLPCRLTAQIGAAETFRRSKSTTSPQPSPSCTSIRLHRQPHPITPPPPRFLNCTRKLCHPPPSPSRLAVAALVRGRPPPHGDKRARPRFRIRGSKPPAQPRLAAQSCSCAQPPLSIAVLTLSPRRFRSDTHRLPYPFTRSAPHEHQPQPWVSHFRSCSTSYGERRRCAF